jgi:hypothetical protein
MQMAWPFASNFDFGVVGFASSFDVGAVVGPLSKFDVAFAGSSTWWVAYLKKRKENQMIVME